MLAPAHLPPLNTIHHHQPPQYITNPHHHGHQHHPHQIEIFTWSASGAIVTELFASSFPTLVAYVVDTPRVTNPQTFMSNMLQVGVVNWWWMAGGGGGAAPLTPGPRRGLDSHHAMRPLTMGVAGAGAAELELAS